MTIQYKEDTSARKERVYSYLDLFQKEVLSFSDILPFVRVAHFSHTAFHIMTLQPI